MSVSRRDFLTYCFASAASLGLSTSTLGKLEKAFAATGSGKPTVIWLNGANCTGCTISLANHIATSGPADVADLLINYLNLAFHPNLMGAAGDLAVHELLTAIKGDYILAVDGGIPTAFGGHTCLVCSLPNGREITAKQAVTYLADPARGAIAVLSIGTCSSFGGIPAGGSNPTGIKSVAELTGRSTINIPGCPAHPDWVVGTVAELLAGNTPQLDAYGRPSVFFQGNSRNVHRMCPRREREEAETFGVPNLCLEELGCKGPRTQGDCPTRMWNDGTNWCVGANSVCIGCTEPGFPDSFAPFYSSGD